MGKSDACQEDCKALLFHIKHQEKLLKQKRRWLIGISNSNSDPQQLRKPKFLKYRALPESLLRDDDLFYETVKDYVQELYGTCDPQSRRHFAFKGMQVFDLSSIEKTLSTGLDEMTTKGLFLLANVLTGGSVRFEKSRSKMKTLIREIIPKVLKRQADNCGQAEILSQLSELLCDPCKYKKKHGVFFTFISLYHRAAARKMLNALEEMPYEALLAMHRKLRGARLDLTNLNQRSGWNRNELISQVRKTCQKMLSQLGQGDSLQEPLAKAMAVAGLSLKLTTGSQESSLIEFYQFSSEIKALQEQIMRAIILLEPCTKIRMTELKNVQLLLDPNAKISNRSLRAAIKKLLIKFLFECSDMDKIPKYLIDAVAILNRSTESVPRTHLPQEEVEADVERILSLSAQTKQIVWDLLPDWEFDQDFDDAYKEDSEESDDGGNYDSSDDEMEEEQWQLEASNMYIISGKRSQIEGTGESMPPYTETCTSTCKNNYPYSALPVTKISSDSFERFEHGYSAGMNFSGPNNASSSSPLRDLRFNNVYDVNMGQERKDSTDMVCTPEAHECGLETRSTGIVCTPAAHESGLHTKSTTHGNLTCQSEANELEYFSEKALAISPSEKNTYQNQYLAIQEACDETSVLAYNFIGHLLYKFARMEGLGVGWSGSLYLRGECPKQDKSQASDATATEQQCPLEKNMGSSTLLKLVEDMLPSLSNSAKEKLEALVG